MATGLFPAAEAWFNSPLPDYYPGQTVAGFNPAQMRGWGMSQAAAGDVARYAGGLGGAYGSYVNQGPQMNPYLDQVADAYRGQMGKMFSEQIMPSLRGSQIAANNAGSSGAALASARAADDFQQNISNQLANLYSRGFESTQNRYLSALGQAPGQVGMLQSALSQPGAIQQQIGGLQQMLQQRRMDDEMQRWQYYRDAPERRLQTYAGLLGEMSMPTSSTQTSTATGQAPAPRTNWSNLVAGGLMYASPYLTQAQSTPNAPVTAASGGAAPLGSYYQSGGGGMWNF